MILFPPAKYNFNNSVSLNAFASKAATNAVIVGHSSNGLEFLLTVVLQQWFSKWAESAILRGKETKKQRGNRGDENAQQLFNN